MHLVPAADRIETIAAAIRHSGLSDHHVRSETGYLTLPLVGIDHANLLYWPDNGRILLELNAFARQSGVDAGLLGKLFSSRT